MIPGCFSSTDARKQQGAEHEVAEKKRHRAEWTRFAEDAMADTEENLTTTVDEAPTARAGSVSSSSEHDTNEEGSSTPPSIRKTRSSGPLSISNKIFESINTTRRSARRDNFLKSTDSEVNRPRIGNDFQAQIPDIVKEESEEKFPEDENIKMWIPVEWNSKFDQYCEIARVCRKVTTDVALKHLLDREYDLEKALIDFEQLPISESIQWSKNDFDILLIELGKTGAQVVEKRYELFHQLCYGPSHWLCPQMRNCTTEDPVTYRRDCENCSTHLYKSTTNETAGRRLCNACQLYTEITGSFRPFSTPIDNDELISKNLEAVEEYESDEDHYECFTEPLLEERQKQVEWTTKEEEKCVQGFRKHGLNFDSIAEELETKTESQIEQFYLLNRHRYSIDTIVASSEKERETPPPPSRSRRSQEENRTPTPATEDISEESKTEKEPGCSQTKERVVEAVA
ncbi:hypothetical protein M3Y97_00716100 [Aphelenchoides bicaudatus]|nr:hypothetical protein M3Y97_00716100 [Aphelenchoides bicaudatus]